MQFFAGWILSELDRIVPQKACCALLFHIKSLCGVELLTVVPKSRISVITLSDKIRLYRLTQFFPRLL